MIKHICTDEPSILQKFLEELPAEAQILSIYGLNSRHWAWVKLPAPQVVAEKPAASPKSKTRKTE